MVSSRSMNKLSVNAQKMGPSYIHIQAYFLKQIQTELSLKDVNIISGKSTQFWKGKQEQGDGGLSITAGGATVILPPRDRDGGAGG